MRNDDIHPDDSGPFTIVERVAGNAALGQIETQTGDPARILIRVTSIRRRLLDEDNLCEKYHVDCCRYAGIVSDDTPDKTHIEVRQRKAIKGEEEHVIVEVIRPNHLAPESLRSGV